MVKKVTRYQTSDGTQFKSFLEAEKHESHNANLASLDAFFKKGRNISERIVTNPKTAARLRDVLDNIIQYHTEHGAKQPATMLVGRRKVTKIAKSAKEDKKEAVGRGGKIVVQYDANGKELKHFGSMTKAAEKVGVHVSSISQACRGKVAMAGGYLWSYKGRKPHLKHKVKPSKAAIAANLTASIKNRYNGAQATA